VRGEGAEALPPAALGVPAALASTGRRRCYAPDQLPASPARRTPRLHGFVRECVCRQLAARAERYAGFVPGDYRSYCASMARSSTWGDHVTLQVSPRGTPPAGLR
jgi:hypothetical protein